jgi:N-acetyl-gamma-glutamyl-phosphate reductase
MTVRVFIDGAVGTTGLEIRDRLEGRSGIELMILADADRKDPAKREDALNSADFVILCLPDDAAREATAMIRNDHVRVIDASTAHRIAPDWVYGFAELEPGQAAAIAEAKRVSNPGCYPTGFLALVRPLIRAGLVPHDYPRQCRVGLFRWRQGDDRGVRGW